MGTDNIKLEHIFPVTRQLGGYIKDLKENNNNNNKCCSFKLK